MYYRVMLNQTHVVVHLDDIQANLLAIRAAMGPSRKVLLSVKANAYGHGAVGVARTAAAAGVDWLGVATVPEGLELRQVGITLPVLKLSLAFPEEMDAAVVGELTLAVCDKANAAALEAVCAARRTQATVHLVIDTGMAQIGVQPLLAPEFAGFLAEHCRRLRIQGVFTHLPVSDAANPTYTEAQVLSFRAAVEAVEARLGRNLELVHY